MDQTYPPTWHRSSGPGLNKRKFVEIRRNCSSRFGQKTPKTCLMVNTVFMSCIVLLNKRKSDEIRKVLLGFDVSTNFTEMMLKYKTKKEEEWRIKKKVRLENHHGFRPTTVWLTQIEEDHMKANNLKSSPFDNKLILWLWIFFFGG